ncbi:probable transmembrane ascorbate ferrireductase 3 [Corylus avellana]|uniref:probable transmembrane ascorbate ferrireductase 3 n=1 Tax=Corylus avellana TaxID=13451 RepID=UPI001E2207A1|nr:probable transmembrane ascorbate ferrireductase 3 [Corylus avellana]
MDVGGQVYVGSSLRVTVVARVFGILAIILMLVWLLHYREGLEYDSEDPYRVFNVHPFLMLLGLVISAGEAMMTYRSVAATHNVQKFVHMFLNLLAICLGIAGICAVFKFHDMAGNLEDVYSLHSWIGIATISLYCLQWLIGFVTFMFPKASRPTRSRIGRWHAMGGRALLYMAICAALTGLMEKATFLKLQHQHESRLVNFTGLSILLFGVFVEFSLTFAAYRVNI